MLNWFRNLKKGFTLIELLAVIIIMSIILIIGSYFGVNFISKSNDEIDKLSLNNIYKSAELYAKELYSANQWINKDGDVYSCVSVEMLIDRGYLKSFKNDKINNDTIIKLYKNNNSSKIISKEHFSNKDFNNKCSGYEPSSDIVIEINKTTNSSGWYLEVPIITIKTINPISGNYYNYSVKGDKTYSSENISGEKITNISDLTNGEYEVCVNSYNSIGLDKKEKCINVKIDTTNPSMPSITLTNNKITISSSDSNVTYKYSTNGGSSYTTGSSFTLNTTATIKAKAVEKSGRESAVNTKTLTVNNATNIDTVNKYYCSYTKKYYNTSASAIDACTYEVEKQGTKKGTTYYQCSLEGVTTTNTNRSIVENACTATGKHCIKCDYTSTQPWTFTNGGNNCVHNIENTSYFNANPKNGVCYDDDMYGKCFSQNVTYMALEVGESIMSMPIKNLNYNSCIETVHNCVSGFTRGKTTCLNEIDSTTGKCNKRCYVTCEKTVGTSSSENTYLYMDNVKDNNWFMKDENNKTVVNEASCMNMTYDYKSSSSTKTYSISTLYSCDGTKNNLQTSSTCTYTYYEEKTDSTKTEYYCSHTNKYYKTKAEAQTACSNICYSGNLYNDKCYELK